jgi:hypothetical protein
MENKCKRCGTISDEEIHEGRCTECDLPFRSSPSECSDLSLAKQFHRTYERLAPSFGYETRADTRDFDPDTPNGRLMVAVCKSIIEQNASNQGLPRERQ